MTIKVVQIKLAPVVLLLHVTHKYNTVILSHTHHFILAKNFGDKHLFASE